MRHVLTALLLATASSVSLAQAQGTSPILTLEEAVTLALRNNPNHLRSISSRSRSGAQLRASYGAFLPQVSSGFGATFREGGQEIFQGQQFGSATDVLTSGYQINISANYSATSFMQPRVDRANLNAAEADVTSSAASTRALVVTQYLNVLQAQAQAALNDTLLANAQATLELNRAREAVGAATSLQVRQSEVTVGTNRVAVLRQRNAVENALLVLFQQMGVAYVEGTRLTTAFPVTEPAVTLDQLLQMARQANPVLSAARARETASNVSVSQARSRWIPSINLSTGFSGNSRQETNIEPSIAQAAAQTEGARRSCLSSDSLRVGAGLAPRGGCDAFVFTDTDAAAIRSSNEQFPFTFAKNPLSYNLSVSLPLFDGFRREQQIQNAQASRNEARYTVRAQELQLTTDITSQYRNLVTQYQTVALQEQNRATAQQALDLAQERYRVGASTFVEVSQARADFERASTDHINSIYDFHKFYAALEQAVGRPLR